ncbi:hypothetical protein I7I48_10655 [Histoplasma ohiense]|nr:hypothetical protein I7I48_10655 [Histoplasma ohiense (nom. inval.)]
MRPTSTSTKRTRPKPTNSNTSDSDLTMPTAQETPCWRRWDRHCMTTHLNKEPKSRGSGIAS